MKNPELRDELEDWPEGDEIIFGCEELEFCDLKSVEPTPSSWSSTRPSTKMQRQASGMSMNRLSLHCLNVERTVGFYSFLKVQNYRRLIEVEIGLCYPHDWFHCGLSLLDF